MAAATDIDLGFVDSQDPQVSAARVSREKPKAGHNVPEDLVSVIIPTFNRAYCIGRTIDSARGQTHQNSEILVVDDGSTDGTRELIERTYAGDSRVRYFFHENQGVTAARNRGIDLCRGDFVALLDSDDTWPPWKLELQLACMRKCPEVGMVWTDMEAVGPGGELVSRSYLRTLCTTYRWFPRHDQLFSWSFPLAEITPGLGSFVGDRRLYTGEIFSQMIMGSLVQTSTVLLRRDRLERVGGFNEELRPSGEDYDFHLRTCREGPVGYIDLAAMRYRIGDPDQLTRDSYRIHIAMNCLKTVRPWIEERRSQINLPDRMLRLRMAEVHSWVGEKLVNAGDAPLARVHLRRSLRHQIWQFKAWKFLALALLPDRFRERLRSQVRSLKGGLGLGEKQTIAPAKAD
jgi:glycosyltransferase involved in cell wall biosynthesis